MAEYTEIFGDVLSGGRERVGRVNEGVEEGLRDYRRRQSAKKMRVHLFFIRENIYYPGG